MVVKQNAKSKRDRLSIDVPSEVHLQIKVCAALHGKTIRDYILDGIRQRLLEEMEGKEISVMTTRASTALQALWDNERDAAYDDV